MDKESSNFTIAIKSELSTLNKKIDADIISRKKVQKLLTNLNKAIEDDNYELVNQLLNKGYSQIINVYNETKPTLEKLQIDVNRRLDEQAKLLGMQLEKYCIEHDLPLKSTGKKYVVNYFLEIEINQQKGRVQIGNLSISSFKWERIIVGVESELNRLWHRGVVPKTFRDRLFEAYKKLNKQNLGGTDWVPLDKIYQICREQIKAENPDWKKGGRLIPYYKDEFSVDLSLLWQAQASNLIDQPLFEFSAIRDPRRSYKVLQPDQNIGFYGFLRPKGG